MKNNRNFAYYKIKISLVDYILQEFGFSEDSKSGWKIAARSTLKSPRLIKFQNNEKIDVITICNHNSSQAFWSHYNNNGHFKSILDFVIQEYNLEQKNSLIKATSILDEYIDSPKYISIENSNFKPAQVQDTSSLSNNKIENVSKIDELDDYTYLKSRNISEKTISNPVFKDQIKQIKVYNLQHKKHYINTVFPLRNLKNEVVCLSIKNRYYNSNNERISFKSFSGKIGSSAWLSNNCFKDLDELIVVESAEDALAYFELNRSNAQTKQIRFFSFEGEPSTDQINLLNALIDNDQPKKVVFSLDRDMVGLKHLITILAKIYINENRNYAEEIIPTTNLWIHSPQISISNKGGQLNSTIAKVEILSKIIDLDSIINRVGEYFSNCDITKPYELRFEKKSSQNVLFICEFETTFQNMGTYIKWIIKEKFNFHPIIKVRLSELKDFGEDLESRVIS